MNKIQVELQKLKDSNKNIIAIGDYFSRSGYYLASFADEIIMKKIAIISGADKKYYPFLKNLK